MKETKPFFLIKKYHSILRAAIIVESVSFIVSLTDGIVAGNALGQDAFAAVGLLAPFFTASLFFSSIVNTGTVLNFSYQIGKFNKQRANEFFSQGLITALLVGAIYAGLLLLFGNMIITHIPPNDEIMEHLRDYFYIILLFVFLQPVSFLMDNIVIADGGEKLSVAANVTLIVSNVAGSVAFVILWDIKGIAIASVLSKVLFLLIISLHFFNKKKTLHFVFHWKKKDLAAIFRGGIAKASTYGLEALLTFTINFIALAFFDDDTFIILMAVEKFLGLLTLFIGLSMACQPLLGTLQGEKNVKAQSALMKTVLKDMIIISAALTLITFFGAPLIATLFGIDGGQIYQQTVQAIRIVSSTLVLQGILVLFFIYYVFINKQLLAFFICLIKNLISPAVLAVVLVLVFRSQTGIWAGLAIAPVLAIAVSSIIVYLEYGKKMFPFLIEENPDQQIRIYDFTIDDRNAVLMSETAQEFMERNGMPAKLGTFAGMLVEDTLVLIRDKNKDSGKSVKAECTLIAQTDGVRLILRDSGMIFDLTDADSAVDSFRQYIVSNLMMNMEKKLYMITTGYNRNEFFFRRNQEEA